MRPKVSPKPMVRVDLSWLYSIPLSLLLYEVLYMPAGQFPYFAVCWMRILVKTNNKQKQKRNGKAWISFFF